MLLGVFQAFMYIVITLHLSCSLSLFTIQQQEQDPTNLYISNLPLSMDEQELENMLKHFGQVISTRILRDASGASRGVGFARSDALYWCYIQHIRVNKYCMMKLHKRFPTETVGRLFWSLTNIWHCVPSYQILQESCQIVSKLKEIPYTAVNRN